MIESFGLDCPRSTVHDLVCVCVPSGQWASLLGLRIVGRDIPPCSPLHFGKFGSRKFRESWSKPGECQVGLSGSQTAINVSVHCPLSTRAHPQIACVLRGWYSTDRVHTRTEAFTEMSTSQSSAAVNRADNDADIAVVSSALVHAPGSAEHVAQSLGWLTTLAKTNGGDARHAARVQCSDSIRRLLESNVAGSMQAIRGLENLMSKVEHNWKDTNTELELFVFLMEGLPTLIAAAPAADSPDYHSRTRSFQLLETVLETIFAHGYTTRLGELPDAGADALSGLLEEGNTYRSQRVCEIMIDAQRAVEPSLFLEAPRFLGAAKAYLLHTLTKGRLLTKGSLGINSKQAKLLRVMGLGCDDDETLACALKSYMAPAGRVDFSRACTVIYILWARKWDLQGYDTRDRTKDTHKSVSALPVFQLAEHAVSLMKAWKNQHPGGDLVGVYVVCLVELLAEADEHSDSRRTLDVVRMLTTDGMLEQVIENAEYDAMQPDRNPYSQMDALSAMLKASPPGYRGYIGKKIMTSPSCLKPLARWMSLVHGTGEEKGLPRRNMRRLTQPLDPFQRGKLFDAFAAHHESAELSIVLTRASPIAGILNRAQRDYATHQLGRDLQAATYCPEKGDRKKSEPNARMLVRCANRAGLINEPLESILEKFAGMLDAVRARREAHCAEMEGSKYEIGLEIKRIYAGARTLRNLEEAWRTTAWKEFRAGINALRDGAADTMTQLLGAAGGSGTASTSLPSTPAAPLLLTGPPQADVSMTAPAAPLLLTGPAPSGVSSGVSEASMEATARAHLRARTERVPDCGGCEVLRTEPAARANFSKRMANGDRGGWCLLHAHKISMARLEAMVGEVAPTLTAPAKRKLAQAFMDEEYGISEVLSSKQPKVTLYGGADGTTQVGSDGQPSKTARHSLVYGGVREVASM